LDPGGLPQRPGKPHESVRSTSGRTLTPRVPSALSKTHVSLFSGCLWDRAQGSLFAILSGRPPGTCWGRAGCHRTRFEMMSKDEQRPFCSGFLRCPGGVREQARGIAFGQGWPISIHRVTKKGPPLTVRKTIVLSCSHGTGSIHLLLQHKDQWRRSSALHNHPVSEMRRLQFQEV